MIQLTKDKDSNYLCKVVNISSFYPHPNAQLLKCCHIDGYTLLTSIAEKEGLYIYFPTLSQINPELLKFTNSYRDSSMNKDKNKAGLFEQNGKVKAIKLRGIVSEGFIIPIQVFKDYLKTLTNQDIPLEENTEFSSIRIDSAEHWICRKFVIKEPVKYYAKEKKGNKSFNKVIENQFRFHYTTAHIKKYPNVINPYSLIHISSKWHGTSGISSYVLCKQKLNWKQKIAKWLTGESFYKYDYLYSSRTVIKNNSSSGYYGVDVWYEADKIVRPCLTKGLSVYYEIVGYLPNGKYIQKDYDYGCIPPTDKYIYKENFRIMVYRVTYTNPDGIVYEFSPSQVQNWCSTVGLEPVYEMYSGCAKDLYPWIKHDENFGLNFIEELAKDSNFFMEEDSPDCNNKVPHEGVVIKLDSEPSNAYKLKCFRFVDREIKSNEANIEDSN